MRTECRCETTNRYSSSANRAFRKRRHTIRRKTAESVYRRWHRTRRHLVFQRRVQNIHGIEAGRDTLPRRDATPLDDGGILLKYTVGRLRWLGLHRSHGAAGSWSPVALSFFTGGRGGLMDRNPVLPSCKIPGLDCSGLACLPPPLRLCAAVAESSGALYQTGEGRTCRGSVGVCGRVSPLVFSGVFVTITSWSCKHRTHGSRRRNSCR